MLRKFYEKLDDIPENLRGAYVQGADGKFHLDRLDETHPLVTKKNELLATNATLTTTNQTISREKGELEKNLLPQGKVAVDASDADVLNKIRPLVGSAVKNLTDVPNLLKEHGTLKEKVERSERENHIVDVAKAMNWKEDAAKLLLPSIQNMPNLVIKDAKDAKNKDIKAVFAEVASGTGDNKFVEKPFLEIVESTPALKALLPSLVNTNNAGIGAGTKSGTVLDQSGTGQAQSAESPTAAMLKKNYAAPGAENNKS